MLEIPHRQALSPVCFKRANYLNAADCGTLGRVRPAELVTANVYAARHLFGMTETPTDRETTPSRLKFYFNASILPQRV